MEIVRRRRNNVIALSFVVLILGPLAGLVSFLGDNERITNFWIDAQLDESSRARVVEIIEYDFGHKKRHGIFREIPDLDPSVAPHVFSESAPDQVQISEDLGRTTVKIGDPEQLISGSHVYQINYSLKSLQEVNEVVWNAVGTTWQVGMKKVEIHLRSPFELVEPSCHVGRFGSNDACDVEVIGPGHILIQVEGLGAGEGVTVAARPGAPVAVPQAPTRPSLLANDEGLGFLPVALTGLLAAGASMPFVSRLARRRGREQFRDSSGTVVLVDGADLGEYVALHSAAFPDLEPWQGGVLLDERPLARHQTAWLVQRAVEGQIVLEGEKKVTLRIGPAGLSDSSLQAMFDGRDSVELGKQDPMFRSAWSGVGKQTQDFANNVSLWDLEADKYRKSVLFGGFMAGILGVVIAGFGAVWAGRSGWIGLPVVGLGLLIAGAGITAAVRSWELRVRTPEGSATWLSIETFRRYLAQAEAEQADWAAENGVVTQYAAWAIALGEIDRWTKAVKRSSAYQDPRHHRRGMSDLYMIPMLSNLERSTIATAASPSSSSSGGGSVGGGGGGGGGGSW